ncbi:MAG TPA: hypothetical protein VIM59_03900 [Cellvibrio sp.]
MISTTPIFHDGIYQLNLVECKDRRGLAIRFHFEVINIKTGKCMGIYDRLTEGKVALEALVNNIRQEKRSRS